jgi:hypothetical protein
MFSTLRAGSFSVATQQAAEQQARGLKHDNTNSDIDGSQHRGRGGEWKARIDAGNY